MIDPTAALRSFQKAHLVDGIDIRRCELDKDLYVHMDRPQGEIRLTYARIAPGRQVKGIAVFTMADPYDGLPVFHVGYATSQIYRRKGLAKAILESGITELANGMGRNGMKTFYVEAIVGLGNVASQKVASAVLSTETKTVTDQHSGEPALQYLRRIG